MKTKLTKATQLLTPSRRNWRLSVY